MRTNKKRVTVWANISAFIISIGTIRDWDIGGQMKSITKAYSKQKRLNPMAQMHLNVLSEKMGSSTMDKFGDEIRMGKVPGNHAGHVTAIDFKRADWNC